MKDEENALLKEVAGRKMQTARAWVGEIRL